MRSVAAGLSLFCLCTAIACHLFGLDAVAETLGDVTFLFALLALLTPDRAAIQLSRLLLRLAESTREEPSGISDRRTA